MPQTVLDVNVTSQHHGLPHIHAHLRSEHSASVDFNGTITELRGTEVNDTRAQTLNHVAGLASEVVRGPVTVYLTDLGGGGWRLELDADGEVQQEVPLANAPSAPESSTIGDAPSPSTDVPSAGDDAEPDAQPAGLEAEGTEPDAQPAELDQTIVWEGGLPQPADDRLGEHAGVLPSRQHANQHTEVEPTVTNSPNEPLSPGAVSRAFRDPASGAAQPAPDEPRATEQHSAAQQHTEQRPTGQQHHGGGHPPPVAAAGNQQYQPHYGVQPQYAPQQGEQPPQSAQRQPDAQYQHGQHPEQGAGHGHQPPPPGHQYPGPGTPPQPSPPDQAQQHGPQYPQPQQGGYEFGQAPEQPQSQESFGHPGQPQPGFAPASLPQHPSGAPQPGLQQPDPHEQVRRRDLRQSFLRPETMEAPARHGFRGMLGKIGINTRPSEAEKAWRADIESVSQHWPGVRTIAVVNGKGGANKTPTTALLAAVFARYSGAATLAWDNNETRGTLGWRTEQGKHGATVLDLLPEGEALLDPTARAGDISHFVHHQAADKYDVLRSNPHLLSSEQRITGGNVDLVHDVAGRYYRMIIIDSGNDESAEHWLRMIDKTDQLVVATVAEREHAEAGALLLEALGNRSERTADLARNAVVVVSQARERDSSPSVSEIAAGFTGWVREVVPIPYDAAMVQSVLRYDVLSSATQRAWLRAAAAVAHGL